jgi:hypothetical protein
MSFIDAGITLSIDAGINSSFEICENEANAVSWGMCDTAQTGSVGSVNFRQERPRLPSDCSTDSAVVGWRPYPRWRPDFVTKRRLKK